MFQLESKVAVTFGIINQIKEREKIERRVYSAKEDIYQV